MLAELVTKPNAALAIVSFVVVGIIACSGWLWWLWYTLWECRCGNAPRYCKCFHRRPQ